MDSNRISGHSLWYSCHYLRRRKIANGSEEDQAKLEEERRLPARTLQSAQLREERICRDIEHEAKPEHLNVRERASRQRDSRILRTESEIA